MSNHSQKIISSFALTTVTFTAFFALLCPMMMAPGQVMYGNMAMLGCGEHQMSSAVSPCMSFHQTTAKNFVGILSAFSDLFLLALVVVSVFFIFHFRLYSILSTSAGIHLRQRWKQLYIVIRLYFEKQLREWATLIGNYTVVLA
ncbi:MAG: hypothetical protein Q7S66_02870 [bacterium]|nr:hypothetical protein [bacterium]